MKSDSLIISHQLNMSVQSPDKCFITSDLQNYFTDRLDVMSCHKLLLSDCWIAIVAIATSNRNEYRVLMRIVKAVQSEDNRVNY